MAGKLKEKMNDAGQKIAETATKVKNRVSEKVEEASDWAKEKAHQAGHRLEEAAERVEHRGMSAFGGCGPEGSVKTITEHQEVYGSCGELVGKVDHVEGNNIKLTKSDSPDNQHHLIPTSWVARVDLHVHLNKSCEDVKRQWQSV